MDDSTHNDEARIEGDRSMPRPHLRHGERRQEREASRDDRRRRLVRGSLLGAMSAVLALVAVSSLAPTSATASAPVLSPIGTWVQVVHLSNNLNHLHDVSFHIDGTVSETSQNNELPTCYSGTPPCHKGSSSLGLWRPTGTNTFEFTFKAYYYDSTGTLVEYIIPHFTCLLSNSESYTCTSVTAIWSTDGKMVSPLLNATSDATRMTFPPY